MEQPKTKNRSGRGQSAAAPPPAILKRGRRFALPPFRLVLLFLLFLAVVAALAPVYWMFTISLKSEVDHFAAPPPWFNFTPTLEHYYDAFVTRSFGQYLITSAVVAVMSTLCALVLGTLAAYALARFRLPYDLDRKLSLWILSTRMFPAIVTAVPLFLMMRDLRLLDTKASLIIVYTAFNLPFVIWMMRGFFDEIPRDLEEAALVDGDSRLGALVRVVLPLVTPGLAATAVFCLIVSWNEFLFALVLTQTDASMTLPVGIAGRVTQYEIKWGVMSAAGAVAIVPILVFAMAMQKYLVRGLSLGAVKG
ncbi:MAG TPA: carbohydrate ABC transporter permease [Pyrinomonadaceae bacterium]|nr:carbohydrate ABC transporter permease [Pyrinomonadaceae bacterium]